VHGVIASFCGPGRRFYRLLIEEWSRTSGSEDWVHVQDWTEELSPGTVSYSTRVPLQSRYRDDLNLMLDVFLFDALPGLPQEEALLAKVSRVVRVLDVRCGGAESQGFGLVEGGVTGIIHVGAHLGEEAMQYHAHVKNRAVHIECNAELLPRLHRNVACLGQVALQGCLWNTDGEERKFWLTETGTDGSSLVGDLSADGVGYNGITTSGSKEVRTRSWSSLLQEFPLLSNPVYNMLVLDTQGAEFEILESMAQVGDGAQGGLRQFAKILVEVSNLEMRIGQKLQPAVEQLLLLHGFENVQQHYPRTGDVIYVNQDYRPHKPASMRPCCTHSQATASSNVSTELARWRRIHRQRAQGSDFDMASMTDTTTLAKPRDMVLSYSLFGSDRRYTDGALANAKLYRVIFPGWKMRVYFDNSVPESVLNYLRAQDVDLFDMSASELSNKMSWRFTPASDSAVARFCSRDIDSRLSLREKAAVDAWIDSGRKFHIMRDHPWQAKSPMSGGLWCGTFDAMPNMVELLRQCSLRHEYIQDMRFLEKVVWPIAKMSVLQHDSFSSAMYGAEPFPTIRDGWDWVGSVYINGTMRVADLELLRNASMPRTSEALRHPEEAGIALRFITPLTCAEGRTTEFECVAIGLLPGVDYRAVVIVTKDQGVIAEREWWLGNVPHIQNHIRYDIPPLTLGVYTLRVSIYDRFPGLTEDESLLSTSTRKLEVHKNLGGNGHLQPEC